MGVFFVELSSESYFCILIVSIVRTSLFLKLAEHQIYNQNKQLVSNW